jgi:hypothetical protein
VRVYRWLLRLFPIAFRRRFGDDMADVFADRRRIALAALTRLLEAQLFHVTTHDPVALVGVVVLLLGGAGALAS